MIYDQIERERISKIKAVGLDFLLKDHKFRPIRAQRKKYVRKHGGLLPEHIRRKVKEMVLAGEKFEVIVSKLEVSRASIQRIRNIMVESGELKREAFRTGKCRLLTNEIKEKIAEDIRRGKTYSYIKKTHGVSSGTIVNIKRIYLSDYGKN